MKEIFSIENPFGRFMSRLADLLILGICEFLFFLPIITAGASFTAGYDVCMKMHRNEEGPVFHEFVRSFRKNLKESLSGWLWLLAALGFMIFNLFCFRSNGSAIFSFGFGCTIVMTAMAAGFASWYFSYRARFADSTKGAFRCAWGFMMLNLLPSLGMIAVEILILLVLNVSIPLMLLLVFGGMGIITYPKAVFFDKCYQKYIEDHKAELSFCNEEPKDYDLSLNYDPKEKELKGRELFRYRLSKMKVKEKLSYLVDYYGKTALLVAISLIFILFVIRDALLHKQNKEHHVMAVNVYQGNEMPEEKLDICKISYDEHVGAAEDYSDYEKFFIMISVGQIDCALVPESFLSYCNNVDAVFKNVNEVLSEEEIKVNSERLVVDKNSDGEVFACGLRVTNLPYVREMELEFMEDNAGEEMILVYPINADDKGFCREYTKKVLEKS